MTSKTSPSATILGRGFQPRPAGQGAPPPSETQPPLKEPRPKGGALKTSNKQPMNVLKTSQCMDPSVGENLALYEFRMLPEDERAQFEEHLKACGFCAKEVRAFQPVMDMIRTNPDILLPPERPRIWDRLRGWAGARTWAVAAAALVLMALWLPPDLFHNPARLAVVEEPALFSRYEGAGPVKQAQTLSLQGDYPGAARILESAVKQDAENFQARLYLAYVYLKQDRNREAIETLRGYLALTNPALEDQARWLLANAYLKNGQLGDARNALEEIARHKRAHHQQARELLEKLPKPKQR